MCRVEVVAKHLLRYSVSEVQILPAVGKSNKKDNKGRCIKDVGMTRALTEPFLVCAHDILSGKQRRCSQNTNTQITISVFLLHTSKKIYRNQQG